MGRLEIDGDGSIRWVAEEADCVPRVDSDGSGMTLLVYHIILNIYG